MSGRLVRIFQQLKHPRLWFPDSVEQIFKHSNSPVLEQIPLADLASSIHMAGITAINLLLPDSLRM
jgi:hypothetical protein